MTTWSEFKKDMQYPRLESDISADVVIIGGGITGILSAYMLSKAGKKVILIEKKEIGSYATMATTAFITKVIDSDLGQIESLFGTSGAKQVWESGQRAIEEIERIVKAENIDCEFTRCTNYVFASTKKQYEELSEEIKVYKRLQIEADLAGGEKDNSPLGFKNYGHIAVPDQAKFHVAKFIYALAEKAREAGAVIYENTDAKEIEDIEGGKNVLVKTKMGNITARDAIIATYKPLINKKTHLKKGMYMSYIFEVKVPKGAFPEALYEDNSNPYYYFRIDPGEEYDRMIIGGEDHKDIFGKTLVKKSFEGLEKYLKKIMEQRPYAITKKWHGPILEPSDGLPLIGEIKPHVYVATAFSGNGMTYSTISALIFRDLILGKKTPWGVYSPERSLLHPKRLAVKAKDYVEEFFGGAVKNLLS